VRQRGVRAPLAGGFAVAAAGMFLLTGVGSHGSYLDDLLPGMVIAGVGLGVVLVSVAFSVLSGARDEEIGMLSGLNTTGHEVGGSIGLAVLTRSRPARWVRRTERTPRSRSRTESATRSSRPGSSPPPPVLPRS